MTAGRHRLLSYALMMAACAGDIRAQVPPASPGEQVMYRNAVDSTYLTATLALPAGRGTHPGVILLSIAGTQPLVERLTREGYVVLQPVRRHFVAVEPYLQSTYQELGFDVQAAVQYLRGRAEVADDRVAMIAQADDAPAAILAMSRAAEPVPLVLLAPPGFLGREIFQLEQHRLAEVDRWRAEDLVALDRLVDQISNVVLREQTPAMRAFRLEVVMGSATVRLPYNAAFPNDERQIHFFSSPLWHDRLAFAPEEELARLHAPVLLLIGNDEPATPLTEYLAAVRRGLAGTRMQDSTVCLVEGRVRHSFTSVEVDAIVTWLGDRVGAAAESALRARTLDACLPDPPPG